MWATKTSSWKFRSIQYLLWTTPKILRMETPSQINKRFKLLINSNQQRQNHTLTDTPIRYLWQMILIRRFWMICPKMSELNFLALSTGNLLKLLNQSKKQHKTMLTLLSLNQWCPKKKPKKILESIKSSSRIYQRMSDRRFYKTKDFWIVISVETTLNLLSHKGKPKKWTSLLS